ncbi:hypothetical protein JCM11641_008468 [Rhodosporidiobolus odoratus]
MHPHPSSNSPFSRPQAHHPPSSPSTHLQSARPRPPPARQGAPASSRNFAQSSAGGASSHLGFSPATPSLQQSDRPSFKSGSNGVKDKRDSHRGRQEENEREGLSEAQRNKSGRWGKSYVPAEETIRNDYSSHYVSTGLRPQNYLRSVAVENRFAEYPKLAQLLTYKHQLTSSPHNSVPPTFFNLSSLPSISTPSPSPSLHTPNLPAIPPPCLMQRALSTLSPSRFDSILLTPPAWITYEELASLDLGRAAATPGFVWLWVGSGQVGPGAPASASGGGGGGGGGIGLERGRELLNLWGYRRCEDIVWLKTNKRDEKGEGELAGDPSPLFAPTVEHCLMGIRGTVRRSTDSNIVHCNVDTDVIVWEGEEDDPALKPPEIQTLIENFCLGTRRLHLYGSSHALRRGWLTVSAPPYPSSTPFASTSQPAPTAPVYSAASPVLPVEGEGTQEQQRQRWGEPREWEKKEWEGRWRRFALVGSGAGERSFDGTDSGVGSFTKEAGDGKVQSLLPFVAELDSLRPKSPPARNGVPSSGGLGRGRGAGLGITRSGLIPSPQSAPGSGIGTPNSMGRGRGRGGGGMVRPPPPPPMGMPYPGVGMGLAPPVPTGSAPPFPGARVHPHPVVQQHFYPHSDSFTPPPPPPAHSPPQQQYSHPRHNPYQVYQPYEPYAPYPSSPSLSDPSYVPAPPPPPPVAIPHPSLSAPPLPYYRPGTTFYPEPQIVSAHTAPYPHHQAFPNPSPSPGYPDPHLTTSPDHLATYMQHHHLLSPSVSLTSSPSFTPYPSAPSSHSHSQRTLSRMTSSASLAPSLTSSYGGGGAEVDAAGELVYPISSRRTSMLFSGPPD